MALDLLVMGKYFEELMDFKLNRTNFIQDDLYLPSYSNDPKNPYSYPLNGNYYNFSGYSAPVNSISQTASYIFIVRLGI